MNAATLLTAQLAAFPGLNALKWTLAGDEATATLNELGGMHLRPGDPAKGERPGSQTLVIVPAPRALPTMEPLRANGWRIWGGHAPVPGFWDMTAEIADGPARVRLHGVMTVRTDGTPWEEAPPHAASCYFSPPPPELGYSKAAEALSAEWMDRLARHDWTGWEATPLPPATLDRSLWDGWIDLTLDPTLDPQPAPQKKEARR